MIDFALYYAKLNWPVFPLTPGGKVPAISKVRGGHGCLDATLNVDQIEAWWREYPDANIGVATGRRSGLLAIDVDPRATPQWLASLRELELPQTFTVRTASGGFHLYLALPADSRITIGAALLPGIDWRGNGGYIVAAGSVVNDATYTIAKNLPIAPAPSGLLKRIEAHKKFPRPVRSSDGHYVIPDSQRNATLFAMACLLRRFGIELNPIIESLRAVNADQCDPALADEELRTIAASAVRYAPADVPRETA